MPSASLRRRAQLAAFCTSVLIVLASTPVVQGLYSDPSVQLRAVQQRLTNVSPNINVVVDPDPSDLSRDTARWIYWWPPGSQILVYPLMRAGLPLGSALRLISAIALIVGSIGWATWFSWFAMPEAILLALAALFPCVRYASNNVFLYSFEVLAFAAGPWILNATMALLDRDDAGTGTYVMHFALGLAMGAAYWLKDSLGFVAFGAIATIAWVRWRGAARVFDWFGRCAAIAAGAAIPFLVLVTLNSKYTHTSSKLSVVAGWHPSYWRIFVDGVALPALQMTDTYALWDYLIMHPPNPVVRDAIWISAIAVPGGLVTWWLCMRAQRSSRATALAQTTLACSFGLLAAIWVVSNAVDHHPRHIATAAFAVLPLVVSEGFRRWPGLSRGGRAVLAAAGIAYICVPLAYGAVSVVAKVWRFPKGYRPGPAHIYNPLLAETNLAGVRDALVARMPPDALWYVIEPVTALDLPGRSIITVADFEDIDELRTRKYVTSRPLSVRALLPRKFEANGKGDVIRRSFTQAGPWKSEQIAGADYWLWTADLVP